VACRSHAEEFTWLPLQHRISTPSLQEQDRISTPSLFVGQLLTVHSGSCESSPSCSRCSLSSLK
jgi:hypothetical protein